MSEPFDPSRMKPIFEDKVLGSIYGYALEDGSEILGIPTTRGWLIGRHKESGSIVVERPSEAKECTLVNTDLWLQTRAREVVVRSLELELRSNGWDGSEPIENEPTN